MKRIVIGCFQGIYLEWHQYIMNNMAGSMIVDCDDNMSLYVTHEDFARDENPNTFYSQNHKDWYIKEINSSV